MSALMVFTSFFSSSLQTVTLPYSENYFLLFMSYSVLGGLGTGITLITVILAVNAWYPEKKWLSTGAVLIGFGLSILLIGNAVNVLVRIEAIGWRSIYVIIAITIGVIFLAAAVFIKPPSKNVVLPDKK